MPCAAVAVVLAPSPGPGTIPLVLPSESWLFVAAPAPPAPAVTVDGSPVEVALESVGRGVDYEVWRFRIPAAAGDVVVNVGTGPARYRIVPDVTVRHPAGVRASPLGFSATDGASWRALASDVGAPVFEVEWSDDERSGTVAVPADAWWVGRDATPTVVLGSARCQPTSFAWTGPITVQLTALLVDGTRAGPSAPIRLDPPAPLVAP